MLRNAVLAALLAGATAASADTIEEKRSSAACAMAQNGLPKTPRRPSFGASNAGYLYLEFRDFQKGARKNDLMTPIAQSLPKEDALALAEYFAAKPWPNAGVPAASKADADVAIAVNKSIVCTSCHLEEYQGDSSVPRLAGQKRDYLAQNHHGLPQSNARQQSRHVRPHERRRPGSARRDGELSCGACSPSKDGRPRGRAWTAPL